MENICEVEGLIKRYGSLTAVDGLSFSIRRGEIFGLLGPNGAGKTTTIGMISGLLKPDIGQIRFHASLAGRQAVGLCPQNIMIWDTLTCFEQLVFIARMYDVPSRIARPRALSLLSAMGLMEKKGRLAKTLSGGMQRRMNLLLAMMHSPELIILDEPQAGLDPQSRVLVRDFIRSLRDKATVLLTTHDMEEADKLSDRVAIIDHGRLLVLDTPQRLKHSANSEHFVTAIPAEKDSGRLDEFLSALQKREMNASVRNAAVVVRCSDAVVGIREVMDAAKAIGFALDDISIRQKSLEDVFIGLTGRGLRE